MASAVIASAQHRALWLLKDFAFFRRRCGGEWWLVRYAQSPPTEFWTHTKPECDGIWAVVVKQESYPDHIDGKI
jgi:hypothetical protein